MKLRWVQADRNEKLCYSQKGILILFPAIGGWCKQNLALYHHLLQGEHGDFVVLQKRTENMIFSSEFSFRNVSLFEKSKGLVAMVENA